MYQFVGKEAPFLILAVLTLLDGRKFAYIVPLRPVVLKLVEVVVNLI